MSRIPDSSRVARIGLGAFLGWLSLVAGGDAAAQLPPSAKREYLRGAGLYKTRHFAEAAQAFTAAYGQYPSTRLLYDLGQAYRKAGQAAAALSSYEQFLAAARELSPGMQAGVRGYMNQLRTALGKPVAGPVTPPKVMPDLLDPALGPRPTAAAPKLAVLPPGSPAPAAASRGPAPGAVPGSGAQGLAPAAAAPAVPAASSRPLAAPSSVSFGVGPAVGAAPRSPADGQPAVVRPLPAAVITAALGATVELLPRRQLPGKWTIIDPKPGYTLRRAYCTRSEVFVVGDSSMVLAATEGQEVFAPLRTGLPNWFSAVAGSFNAAGGGELFIGGDSGLILRRVGPQLHAVQSGIRGTVFAVTGSNNDWFAFGEGGAAARFDGTAFVPVPTATQNAILGGFAVDREIFAVGAGGMILRWGGASFTSMPSPSRAMLHGIWGTSRSDLWVVGSQGTLLHFDGSGWRSVPSGTQQTLLSIWGSAKNDVYAVGTGGLVLHYDGVSWAAVDLGASSLLASTALSGLCSRGAGELFVVGDGLILRYKR